MSISQTSVPSYSYAWSISGYQKQTLTCLSISPLGTHIAIASEDCNVVLADFQDGTVLGVVGLEDQFSVLAAVWYSEYNLLVGGTNGLVYYVCIHEDNVNPRVTMSQVLPALPEQVRHIALDISKGLLAVGYSTSVALFTCKKVAPEEPGPAWVQTELIQAPSHSRSGLVNALLFFPTQDGHRRLLVAYAEAGWSIWDASGLLQRASPSLNHDICRVGRAALSADEGTIAFSTLDHSIVTYPLDDNGPILTQKREFANRDRANWSPRVPVVLTSDGLVLGGTASGEVPIISTEGQSGDKRGDMSVIRHAEGNHVIRLLAKHGDKIVVGSSSSTCSESIIKCYSTSIMTKYEDKKVASAPFQVSITEALKGWEVGHSKWWTYLEQSSGTIPPTIKVIRNLNPRMTKLLAMCITAIFILILSADPPSGPSFVDASRDSGTRDVLKPRLRRHEYWIVFGIRHFVKYVVFQSSSWASWILRVIYTFAIYMLRVIPGTIDLILMGAAKWMCEQVGVYREAGVCPKLEY